MLRRCVWSRNIKNGCSIYIYDISRLRVKESQSLIHIIHFHIPTVPSVLLNSLLHLVPALPMTVSLLPQICVVNFMATYLLTHCSVCRLTSTPSHTLLQYLYMNSRWTATIIIERNLRLAQRRRNRLKSSGMTLMINYHYSFTCEAAHFGSPIDKQRDTKDLVYSAVSTTQTLMLRVFTVALRYFCK